MEDPFSRVVHGIMRVILTRPLRLIFGCKVLGAENLPLKGPVILASSHASNFDPLTLGISYPGVIRWMAKIELWFPILGWIMDKGGAFPVRRGEADRDAIRQAKELLEKGWVVGFFPQGTRTRGEDLGEGLPGVGMLAISSGVPVIPVRVKGNDRIFRRGWFSRVTITVGEPVDLAMPKMSRGRAYKEAARRIMSAIAEL